MKTKISLIKCTTYESSQVADAVRRAVDLIGGISQFIKPGERILLKPNLIGAREPERAITTHPEVARAIIRLVKEAGATPVMGDSPGGAIKGVERVWEKTGMKKVAEEENIELVSFESSGSIEKIIKHPQINSVHISKAVLEADGIINLPKLKTHTVAIFTGAIKNLYGCVPGLRKAEYHKLAPHPSEFAKLLGEIYLIVKSKIRFNLVDGIVGMEGNGPSSGDLRKLDIIIAGTDSVATDSAIVSLLGRKPESIEMIRYLAKNGGGASDISEIDILGSKPSEFSLDRFRFPANWYMNLVPRAFVNVIGKYLWIKPVIIPEICTACLMCVKSCPVQAITKTGTGKPKVNDSECISCLCCHELCSKKAIDLKTSKLSKLFIRQ